MAASNNNKTLLTVLIVIVIGAVAFFALNAPDRRTPGEKLGDAVGELGDGLEDAGRQLENRTPAEKIGDAVKDAKEDIQENN